MYQHMNDLLTRTLKEFVMNAFGLNGTSTTTSVDVTRTSSLTGVNALKSAIESTVEQSECQGLHFVDEIELRNTDHRANVAKVLA